MFKFIRIFALCATSFSLGAVLLHAQNVFVLPGPGSPSGAVEAFVTNPLAANPLSKITTFNAGAGSFLALANLDATKFYIIADSTTQTITSTDTSFLHPNIVAGLPAAATAAVLTPDGRLLAVAASKLYLFDTTTDAEVTGGVLQGSGITTFDVGSSLQAGTLFALGSGAGGTSQLAAINATTHSVSATLDFSTVATAVTVGPNGLVYVSLPSQIVEVDPRTLKPTLGGEMSVNGTPGRLIFTSDGQFAFATSASSGGPALLIVNLASHSVTAPSLGLPQLTTLQTAGIDSVIGYSGSSLYLISATSASAPMVTPLQGTIAAITASNEVPTGAHATVQGDYAATGDNLYQFNPATQQVAAQHPIDTGVNPGALSFTAAAVTSAQARPVSLLTYGANQTILPNGTSQPLVVRVLDVNNHPILGVLVEFQSSSNSATLSSTSVTTGANGSALTYLTAPATTGTLTVTATVGSLTATFNVDVSASAGGANSSHLTILSGQGQLMGPNTSTAQGPQAGSPLTVLVTDANGIALAGAPVTFSVNPNQGTLVSSGSGGSSLVVNTDAKGEAFVDFLTGSVPPGATTGFVQASVTASSPGTNDVVFDITTVNLFGASVYFLAPTPGSTLTGPEGSTLPAAVSAQVVSSAGVGIPNVSLILTSAHLDPTLYPTAVCNAPSGSFILTNSSGQASCDVTFGPRVGSGAFDALVGYTHDSGSILFHVTPGAAAVIQITQGNNQVGAPGQKLSLALIVHVTDSGGNTLTQTPVTWQVLTSGAVTLSNVSNFTDFTGNASAIATLGSVGGVAQVKVTAGSASATFSITVSIPSAAIQKVSGDLQTVPINTAFAPLVVKVVDSSNNAVPGVQVNFQVTSGAATLSPASAMTDSSGQASTTVTAGATGGAITVSATTSGFSVSFTLTAQLPGPSNITVVNGASFDPNNGISPGGIATISGTGILTGVQGLISAYNIVGPLPTTFEGVTITFNGTPAPIYYVQSANGTDVVTVQVPFEVQAGSAVTLTVNVTNGGSASATIPVKLIAPGVFTTQFDKQTFAVALRPDGSPVSPTNPAQRGENISVYVTGLGQVAPATATGNAGTGGQSVLTSLIIGLNNGGVPLISADYAPGLVGVYVITLQVPANTQTGPSQPLGVIAFDSANNAYFAQPTYIPIQ